MEKNEIKITKQKFKSFIKAFIDLEITFENYYKKAKEKKTSKDNGYLINKKKIDKIREQLSYSEIKIYINDDTKFAKKLEEKFKNIKEIVCEACEQEIFESSKEFVHSISHYKEYEIIDEKVFILINSGKLQEKKGKIFYEISQNNLILSFNSEKVYFSFTNSNVLKSENLLVNNVNLVREKIFQADNKIENSPKQLFRNSKNNSCHKDLELDDLYQSLVEFVKFENLLINKLKSNDNINNEQIEGYFLDKNWFHEWRNCTNYDKNKYKIQEDNNDENIKTIKSSFNIHLKQKIIPINLTKNFNINNYQFILKNDIIALVNDNFLSIFTKILQNFEIWKSKFYIKNHKLIFSNRNSQNYFIYSFNNILPIESNECFIIANNLFELYFFQEILKLNPAQIVPNGTNDLILVDKNWINNYKKKYSYDKICDSIKDKQKILNIIMKNEKKEKFVLNEIISEFNWECFYDIYKVNQQNVDDNYNLELKEINSDNTNEKIQYINNFELIDKNIFNKLKIEEDIKNKISKNVSVRNYINDNKILIQYEINNNKIYIIGYIDKNNNEFISEYFIKSYNDNKLTIFLKDQGISEIIKKEGNNFEITEYNNLIGKLYKIKMEINEKELKCLKAIEALFELYKFYNNLIEKLKNQEKNFKFNEECYLIKEKWFSEFKNIFLYDEICKFIEEKKIIKKETFSKEIYEKFKDKYNNNFKEIFINDKNIFNFEFRISNNQEDIILEEQYVIANKNFVEKIIPENININEIMSSEYYINDKNMILKHDTNNIIIGFWSNNNNYTLFIPEYIIIYNNDYKMKVQFNYFKEKNIDIKEEMKLKGDKREEIKDNNSKEITAKAYHLNKINPENFNYSIQLLLNIYKNDYEINNKINKKYEPNQQFEPCYIVSKNYVERLKKMFNYKEFYNYMKNKDIFDIILESTGCSDLHTNISG